MPVQWRWPWFRFFRRAVHTLQQAWQGRRKGGAKPQIFARFCARHEQCMEMAKCPCFVARVFCGEKWDRGKGLSREKR